MDGLTFIAMQVFCACVLYWYIANLHARSAGERGFLGVAKDQFAQLSHATRAYLKKDRKQALSSKRVDSLKARREADYQSVEQRSGVFSSELHSVRKVTLRNRYGETAERPADSKELNPESRPRKYRQRSNAAQVSRHTPSDNNPQEISAAAPRFRRKDRNHSSA